MMSVVALMVLLLPVLLQTTTSQKLTSLSLGVHSSTSELPPSLGGELQKLSVVRDSTGYRVQTQTITTDVGASLGDGNTQFSEQLYTSLKDLQAGLHEVKERYPQQSRVILIPAPDTEVEELVRWMDAVRGSNQGALYDEVVLATEGNEPEASP